MANMLKRPLSPHGDGNAAPVFKRSRSDDPKDGEGILSGASQRRPMNNLPLPPSHPRPARQLFVFGSGDMGQFGLGTTVMGELPRPRLHAWFESAVQSNVLGEEVAAGIESACAGGMHSLVIDESGGVWSWGINDNAALGRPTVDVADPDQPDQLLEPEILESQPMPVKIGEQYRAVQVAAGDSISVALSATGQLRAWGSFRASDGLLGFDHSLDNPKPQLDPIAVPTLEDHAFVQVACGTDHVLALTQQGTVYVWGNGQQAQLGRRIIERRKTNGLSPERLALRRVVYVAAGSYHSFAVTEKGVVYAWGLNSMRQTGVDAEMGGDDDIVWTPTEVTLLSPKRLGDGRKVAQISGGEHHTLFLLSDGSVYGCGRCDGFELGLGDDHPAILALSDEMSQNDESSPASSTSSRSASFIAKPALIPFPPMPTPEEPDPLVPPFHDCVGRPPANPIARISAGTRHNLAVSRAGHAYAWGIGQVGQLGLGPHVEVQKTPARVRCRVLEEQRAGGAGWAWVVEDAAAGGQHCLLVARKVE